MKNKITRYFETISRNFLDLTNEVENIEKAIECILKSLNSGNKIIFCGNGGSAGD